MTSTQFLQLTAALRITSANSGIMIPLFSSYPSNYLFMATTDSLLNIDSFQEVDALDKKYIGLNLINTRRIQYEIGSLLPIALLDSGKEKVFSAENINDLIDVLRDEVKISGPIVNEALDCIINISKGISKDFSTGEVGIWAEGDNFETQQARLWLDQLTQELFSGTRDKTSSHEEALAHVRRSLLGWVVEHSEVATSKMFEHFVFALERARKAGVQTEDILAIAIIRRVSRGYAERDRLVDLIRNFRRTYARGPLEVAEDVRGVLNRSSIVSKTLDDLFKYIRVRLKENVTSRLLVEMFIADSVDQWPDDIQITLRRMKVRLQSYLENLVSFRTELAARNIQFNYGNLRKNSTEIRLAVIDLDIVNKIGASGGYSDTEKRFSGIDYRAIGISEDFFYRIRRETGDGTYGIPAHLT